MGKAVIYTRVSTRAQEDGYSLAVQEKDGRAYCDRNGYTVVAVESDTFTGHDSLEERDGMQQAIRIIRRGDADTLVIWKVDRPGIPVAAHKNCTGGFYAVPAKKVDPDVWAKVKEIIRDEPRFQRLVNGKSAKLEEQYAEAAHRAELVNIELTDMQARQAMVYERMTRETDDTIHAMHRTELQRLNESIAELEKRAKEALNALSHTQHTQDAHKELLERIDAAIAQYTTEDRAASALPGLRDWLEETDKLDNLSREEKRNIMRSLDLKVLMYPVDSEYARNNPTRWKVTFKDSVLLSHIPGSGDVL